MAVALVTFIFCMFCSDYVHSFYSTYNVSDLYVPLTAIAMDSLTGNIYIGGKNVFMNLDENLMMRKKLSMGPRLDNHNCPPLPETCSEKRNLLDNNIRIVEINNKTDYILVCGTTWQGLCTAHSLSDISEKREFPHTVVTSYVGSNTSSFAFFGHMNRKWEQSDDKLLYVAMGTDGRPAHFAPAVVSVREVNSSGSSWHVNYFVNASAYHSYIDVHNDFRYKFQSCFIYGFENGSYTYFISVQMKDPLGESVENNQFVTKIIQICQEDVTFASYSELPIQCTLDGKIYHLATAAHFGFEHNLIPQWDKKLFVTFGRNDEFSPNPDPSKGSVMCVFSIQSIIEKFQKLQEDCFINGRALRPAWVYGDSLSTGRPCILKTNARLDKFCGSQPNIGIQDNPRFGLEHVLTDFAKSFLSSDIYTSVSAITQNAKTVAVLGTLSGYLLKVLVEENKYKPAYLTYDLTKDRSVRIQRDMQLDRKEQNLYLLSGKQVVKFPLYSCDAHTTCESCVGSGDPLSCGWCGDFCTTKTECIKPSVGSWSADTCPPHIEKIMPSAGPTSGRTYLTITGKNFGNGNQMGVHVTVLINNKLCKILVLAFKRIVCVTPEMQSPGNYPVQLTVKDSTLTQVTYKIDGKAAFGDYKYKNPAVHRFMPAIGPVSGGSNITIFGENFNIGTNRSVTVAYFPCNILSYNDTVMTCQTTKYASSGKRRKRKTADSLAEGPVEVRIDAGTYPSSESFAYLPDATITGKSPERAIISGGIDISVMGTNLNVIANPKIRMSFTKDSRNSVTESCRVSKDGKQMLCKAPNISSLLDESHRGKDLLLLYMSFIMDGIEDLRQLPYTYVAISIFRYHPDPQFHKFKESDHTRYFDLSTELLDIKGSKITFGITKRDVTVMIGNSQCNVTKLEESVMYCKPVNRPNDVASNEPKRIVRVLVGYLIYDIGYLVYVGQYASVNAATIAIGVVIAVLVLAIIAIIVLMKIRHYGPFKDKTAKGYGAQYTQGREVNFEGLDSAGQRIFDLQNRENAYAEQRLSGTGSNGAVGGEKLIMLDDDLLLVLQDKNLLIERDWLTVGEIIGRGHFGCVYKGFITFPDVKGDTPVAVKTLHQNSPREIDVKAFIDEALRMKDFNHENVLTLTGICFGVDDMPLVILPFMSLGDLLSYIRNESKNPTIKDLIMFGVDIAKGMQYLSGLKFVHRDLACRNCMLDDDYKVKVADFGLSRDIYERDYYSSDNKKSKLPVKWMAPESLEKGNYNSKSDVWSFGVVLWELMTRGVNPYPEVDNWDVLRYIKSGRRMPQPPYCPDSLYLIMQKCWAFNPNERPKFSILAHEITDMITILQQQMKQGKEMSDIQNTYVNTELCTNYHYADSPPVAAGETSEPSSPTEVTPITVVNSKQDPSIPKNVMQTDV